MRAASMAARASANPTMFSRDEPFHVGDRIDHRVGGGDEWWPAIVREYTAQGQATPWRIAFDYEGGGSGAVLLDDELNKVRVCAAAAAAAGARC